MCVFHSFLVNARNGHILESMGLEHHSQIAEAHGVSQDKFALPEFHLDRRALVFDGGLPLSQAMLRSLREHHATGRQLLRDKWAASEGALWSDQVLARLDDYLLNRFGTADRVIRFVEPNWKIAQDACRQLLTDEARSQFGEKRFAEYEVLSAELSAGNKNPHGVPQVTYCGEPVLANGRPVKVLRAQDVRLFDGAGHEIPEPLQLVVTSGGLTVSCPLTDSVKEWMMDLALDELILRARVEVMGDIDFAAWAKEFQIAESRTEVWQKDAATLVAS